MKKASAIILILSSLIVYMSWVKLVALGYVDHRLVLVMTLLVGFVFLPFFLFIYSRAYLMFGLVFAFLSIPLAIHFYRLITGETFDFITPLLFMLFLVSGLTCVIGVLTRKLKSKSSDVGQ